MKKFYILPFIFYFSFFILNSSFAQVAEWVWLNGPITANGLPNYGTQGVPASTNIPPAVYEACEFTDSVGNFWLFGGADATGWTRADLWRYNPSTNQWTWMKGPGTVPYLGSYGTQGVTAPTNLPPQKDYGATTWTDNLGNLWMFGGRDRRNDLWKYDVASNEWTWMKGSNLINQPGVYGTRGVPNINNTPGARYECAAAWTSTDTAGVNYLWLFGGYSDMFNDLWRYNIATNMWTWMKGPNTTNQPGVYGTLGVEDSLSTPGCRGVYARWKDANGNFWLFGGQDNLAAAYNDMWRYNPVTNNWTWMGGSNITGATGVYGTQCVLAPANIPGCRFENRAAWTDRNGNFWMMGGAVGNSFQDIWNDLWMYCVANNQWMWVSGDTISVPTGNWGTMGVSSPSNKPDGRAGAISWTDRNGHLYLFGGSTSPFMTLHNDLWKFTIDPACGNCSQSVPVANFTSSDTTSCSETGVCINFFDHSTGATRWQWLFPGASPDTSSRQNPDSICYSIAGTYAVTLIVTNSGGTDTLTVSPMITLIAPPSPPTVTVLGGDTLLSSHGSFYQWYRDGFPIAGATDSFYVAMQPGTYSVRISDTNGCSSQSAGVLMTAINEMSSGIEPKVYPNPTSQWAIISWPYDVRGYLDITVLNVLGEKVFSKQYQNLNSQIQTILDVSSLSNGIYLLRIYFEKDSINREFMVLHN